MASQRQWICNQVQKRPGSVAVRQVRENGNVVQIPIVKSVVRKARYVSVAPSRKCRFCLDGGWGNWLWELKTSSAAKGLKFTIGHFTLTWEAGGRDSRLLGRRMIRSRKYSRKVTLHSKNLENVMKVWMKGLRKRAERVLEPDSGIKIERAEKLWMTFPWLMKTDHKDESTFLLMRNVWGVPEGCALIPLIPISLNIFNNYLEKVVHWNEEIHSDIVSHTCACTHCYERFQTS